MSDEMSEKNRGFDDATAWLMTNPNPLGPSTGYYKPPPYDDACEACQDGRHAPAAGCPRCDYDEGWNDGVCK